MAFTQIFHHYRDKIYGVAFNFLRNPESSEEIVQDVFLKLWLKRAELDLVRSFDSFLFVMARNQILDRLKKRAYEVSDLVQEVGGSPADEAEWLARHHECERLLREALCQLSPKQQEVYRLAKNQGMSHQRIADELCLSRKTIKTHMAQALRTIRQFLSRHL